MTAPQEANRRGLVAVHVETAEGARARAQDEASTLQQSGSHAAGAAARHRARALSPDDRRAAIIAATQPLLREYGVLVTTSQIAQAAGIAEGTIFRVFPDKRQLIAAALQTAMRGDAEVERILQIPLTAPLPERLVAALKAIVDYQDRFWALVRVFRETGWPAESDELRAQAHTERPIARIRAAISALLAPEARSLRQEPDEAARTLLALTFGDRMTSHGLGEPPQTPEQLVERFLHGAINPESRSDPNA